MTDLAFKCQVCHFSILDLHYFRQYLHKFQRSSLPERSIQSEIRKFFSCWITFFIPAAKTVILGDHLFYATYHTFAGPFGYSVFQKTRRKSIFIRSQAFPEVKHPFQVPDTLAAFHHFFGCIVETSTCLEILSIVFST